MLARSRALQQIQFLNLCLRLGYLNISCEDASKEVEVSIYDGRSGLNVEGWEREVDMVAWDI